MLKIFLVNGYIIYIRLPGFEVFLPFLGGAIILCYYALHILLSHAIILWIE